MIMRRLDMVLEPTKQQVFDAAAKPLPDALRDGGVVGYEIPFTRHFYEYTPLRPSADILAEIRELEADIAEKLEGVLQ